MKTKNLATLSSLAGGVLVILALFRGTLGQLLLIAYLCLWAIIRLIGWMRQPLAEQSPDRPPLWESLFGTDASAEDSEALGDAYALLVQHVEARITDLLRSVYPQAEWYWCEEDPETIIREGGTAWIRTKNTGSFRDACLSFEEPGDLHLEFIQTAPLRDLATETDTQTVMPAPPVVVAPVSPAVKIEPEAVPPKEEDVQLWYSLVGQKALTEIITELNIRHCSQITIGPHGEVTITTTGGEPQKGKTLEQMPSPDHWEELKQLLEQQDLKVSIQGDQMSLAWQE